MMPFQPWLQQASLALCAEMVTTQQRHAMPAAQHLSGEVTGFDVREYQRLPCVCLNAWSADASLQAIGVLRRHLHNMGMKGSVNKDKHITANTQQKHNLVPSATP